MSPGGLTVSTFSFWGMTTFLAAFGGISMWLWNVAWTRIDRIESKASEINIIANDVKWVRSTLDSVNNKLDDHLNKRP